VHHSGVSVNINKKASFWVLSLFVTDFFQHMASLWQQHKLLQSFSKYNYSPALVRNMEKTIAHFKKILSVKDGELPDIMEKQMEEFHKNSETGFIKKDDLIHFHYGYSIPWWRPLKKRRRQWIIRDSALLTLYSFEGIKDILRSCLLNHYLKDEGGGYVSITSDGQNLKEFDGWWDEVLKKRDATKQFVIGAITALGGASGILLLVVAFWNFILPLLHHNSVLQ
jgi:hypothetical protein